MSDPPLIDARPDHLDIVREILRRHVPERKVWAFGSRVTWTAKTYSDLDLVILGDEPLDLGVSASLKEDFSESDLPWKVDVVDWAGTSESFRKIIRKNKVEFPLEKEWRKTKWGEEISLEYGKAIRDYKNAIAPYRVFGTNGPVGWVKAPLAPGPGIILGRKGAYRGVYFSREPFFVIDTAYYVKPKSEELDMRWLYYAIIYHKLGEIDDGSPIPSTTRAAVYVRDLDVPSPPEQRTISSTLASLDNKIDLNLRMNETLEAMARAIFKDWFVNFGLTHAKVEGHEPYLAQEIWDLFPDKLDDEGKPEGWKNGTLGDVADSPRTGVDPSEIDSETPYIGLEHMLRKSIALSEWAEAGKVSSSKSAFKKGDFLFGKLRPYFHKVGTVPVDGICSTDIAVVRPKEETWQAFVISCISTGDFVSYTDKTSTGTKMSCTSWKTMSKYELCLPSKPVVHAFQNMVQPMIDRIVANIHESRTFAQTRDLLLPKLMSGEIRVRDAEKAVIPPCDRCNSRNHQHGATTRKHNHSLNQ